MTKFQRHCAWLLLAYPASYRTQRAEEMTQVLEDVSRPGASWPPLREVPALIGTGMRRRLGLAADQPLGQISELVAGWYLLLGVSFAATALLFGEWSPWTSTHLRAPYGFGPFATDGAPVYALAALTGLSWWLGRPAMSRGLATATFGAAAAMVFLEHHVSYWGRPPLSFVIPLLACVVPTLVRPPGGERRSRRGDRAIDLIAAVTAAAIPIWCGLVDLYLELKYTGGDIKWTGRGPDFYRLVLGSVARWVPLAALVVLVVAVALVARDRRDIATGLVVISAPWLLLATMVEGSTTFDGSLAGSSLVTVATASPSALLVSIGFAGLALWLIATRRTRMPMEPLRTPVG